MTAKQTRNLLTQEGQSLLRARLERLENELAEVSRGKMEAAETGGNLWHDNPAYEEIETKQRMLGHEIARIKNKLSSAEIINVEKRSAGKKIAIGSRVEIGFTDGGIKTIIIGDPETAAPELGIISYESPLGSALIGAKAGEKRTYSAGGKIVEATITAIK